MNKREIKFYLNSINSYNIGERLATETFNEHQIEMLSNALETLFNYYDMKKSIVKLNFKKVVEDAITPSYAHGIEDACFDIHTSEEVVIGANETTPIKTGIAFEIPKGYKLSIKNRSGITIKGLDGNYVRVMLGTVDQGYRNEVMIMTYNQENHSVTIPKHTKLAQIELEKVVHADLRPVTEFSEDTKRGLNGFGSTDK